MLAFRTHNLSVVIGKHYCSGLFDQKNEISLVSVREYDWKETAAVGVKTKTLAHATYNGNTKTMCPWALLCDILDLKRNMYTACVNVCDILLPWNSRFLETEFIFSAYLCTRPHVLSQERSPVQQSLPFLLKL